MTSMTSMFCVKRDMILISIWNLNGKAKNCTLIHGNSRPTDRLREQSSRNFYLHGGGFFKIFTRSIIFCVDKVTILTKNPFLGLSKQFFLVVDEFLL